MKKVPAPARSNNPVPDLKSRVRIPRPSRQGKPLGPRAKPNRRQPDGRFRFSDDQWGPIRDRSGFDDKARKRVERFITIYRNEREAELLGVPPAETRAELAKLQSLARDLWKQIEHCADHAKAWDAIFDFRARPGRMKHMQYSSVPAKAGTNTNSEHAALGTRLRGTDRKRRVDSNRHPLEWLFGELRFVNGLWRVAPVSDGGTDESMPPQSDISWGEMRLYTFQNDVEEFAKLIGQAKGRVESASPGARAHHNLNMLIHSLVSMWEEIHAAKFTRTKKRSGPNRLRNGTEFIIRVCKIAEPDFGESTFANAIRYVVEHKAELAP
jgi:hypothetical protein